VLRVVGVEGDFTFLLVGVFAGVSLRLELLRKGELIDVFNERDKSK